jgi:tRNA threonylcarbamoyladenosine biosynthesis protein TsaE
VPEAAVYRRSYLSRGPEHTRAVGTRLGAAAEAGDVILLEGEFGSGKTVFVQGLGVGLGVPTPITSPSFVIINQHQGRLTLYHVDLYRAERLDPELEETVADAVEAGGVTCIEWPRLLPEDLRRGATVVRLSRVDETTREIRLETDHRRLAAALDGEAPGGAAGPLAEGR